jgi:small subunit ribosomal protein S4
MESRPATVGYVTVDADKFTGTFTRLPERNELPLDINESAIIEYYNRKL